MGDVERWPDRERGGLQVALIGYGEVGRVLAENLRTAGHAVSAFDVARSKKNDPLRAHARTHGVEWATSQAEAVAVADLVISAVTPEHAVAAAESSAEALGAGVFFLDLNSVSPAAKIQAAEIIGGASGRFVEGAVMTAGGPYRMQAPLLLGGPYAPLMAPILERMGFVAQVVSIKLGVASATRMCQSVMIKGLEALVIESLTTARHYGVEDGVLMSLNETFPAIDWERQATSFFQQAIEHGHRGGEELREATATVREVGLEPWSAKATTALQDWLADRADAGLFGAKGHSAFARSPDWRVEADRMLDALRRPPQRPSNVPAAQKNVTISDGKAPSTTGP
jgi:3-hydroxyisobutyrate dehydrogenase-like beta-hydroxyacid dehydrogenase